MNSFLRLASLGTLILGLQISIYPKVEAKETTNVAPESSSQLATVRSFNGKKDYQPPDNGGPSTDQGAGTR